MKRSRQKLIAIANATAAIKALQRHDDLSTWSRWMLWTGLTSVRFVGRHLDSREANAPADERIAPAKLVMSQREIDEAYVALVAELIGDYGNYAEGIIPDDDCEYAISAVYQAVSVILSCRADELNTRKYHDDREHDREPRWSAFDAHLARMMAVQTRELHVAPLTIVDVDEDDDDDDLGGEPLDGDN